MILKIKKKEHRHTHTHTHTKNNNNKKKEKKKRKRSRSGGTSINGPPRARFWIQWNTFFLSAESYWWRPGCSSPSLTFPPPAGEGVATPFVRRLLRPVGRSAYGDTLHNVQHQTTPPHPHCDWPFFFFFLPARHVFLLFRLDGRCDGPEPAAAADKLASIDRLIADVRRS